MLSFVWVDADVGSVHLADDKHTNCPVALAGKRTLAFVNFAEEVRDLLVYTSFLPFHPEGEIVVKIHIPPIQLVNTRFRGKKQHGNGRGRLDSALLPFVAARESGRAAARRASDP
ncbi:MAG: hypothetical protein ACRDM8_01740 [Gaiellaceae bacterium]